MAAAARELQRRISSVLFRNQSHANPHFNPSWQLSDFFSTERRRSIQTVADLNSKVDDDKESIQKLDQVQGLVVDDNGSKTTSVDFTVNYPANYIAQSSLKTSARHDLAMIFTCKVCETRSVKTACRESYEKGVVVARCDGCNNLHLIADRLGWFGEPASVEEFLAARGEEVKKGSVDTLNLTPEDLAGMKKLSSPTPTTESSIS